MENKNKTNAENIVSQNKKLLPPQIVTKSSLTKRILLVAAITAATIVNVYLLIIISLYLNKKPVSSTAPKNPASQISPQQSAGLLTKILKLPEGFYKLLPKDGYNKLIPLGDAPSANKKIIQEAKDLFLSEEGTELKSVSGGSREPLPNELKPAAQLAQEQQQLSDSGMKLADYLTERDPQISDGKLNYIIGGSESPSILSKADSFTEIKIDPQGNITEVGTRTIPDSAKEALKDFIRPISDVDYIPTQEGFSMSNLKDTISYNNDLPYKKFYVPLNEVPNEARGIMKDSTFGVEVQNLSNNVYGETRGAKVTIDGKDYYISRPDDALAYKTLDAINRYDVKPEQYNTDIGKITQALKEMGYSQEELLSNTTNLIKDFQGSWKNGDIATSMKMDRLYFSDEVSPEFKSWLKDIRENLKEDSSLVKETSDSAALKSDAAAAGIAAGFIPAVDWSTENTPGQKTGAPVPEGNILQIPTEAPVSEGAPALSVGGVNTMSLAEQINDAVMLGPAALGVGTALFADSATTAGLAPSLVAANAAVLAPTTIIAGAFAWGSIINNEIKDQQTSSALKFLGQDIGDLYKWAKEGVNNTQQSPNTEGVQKPNPIITDDPGSFANTGNVSATALLVQADQAQKAAADAYKTYKKDIDNGNSPDPAKFKDWQDKIKEADTLTEAARQKAQDEYVSNRDDKTAQELAREADVLAKAQKDLDAQSPPEQSGGTQTSGEAEQANSVGKLVGTNSETQTNQGGPPLVDQNVTPQTQIEMPVAGPMGSILPNGQGDNVILPGAPGAWSVGPDGGLNRGPTISQMEMGTDKVSLLGQYGVPILRNYLSSHPELMSDLMKDMDNIEATAGKSNRKEISREESAQIQEDIAKKWGFPDSTSLESAFENMLRDGEISGFDYGLSSIGRQEDTRTTLQKILPKELGGKTLEDVQAERDQSIREKVAELSPQLGSDGLEHWQNKVWDQDKNAWVPDQTGQGVFLPTGQSGTSDNPQGATQAEKDNAINLNLKPSGTPSPPIPAAENIQQEPAATVKPPETAPEQAAPTSQQIPTKASEAPQNPPADIPVPPSPEQTVTGPPSKLETPVIPDNLKGPLTEEEKKSAMNIQPSEPPTPEAPTPEPVSPTSEEVPAKIDLAQQAPPPLTGLESIGALAPYLPSIEDVGAGLGKIGAGISDAVGSVSKWATDTKNAVVDAVVNKVATDLSYKPQPVEPTNPDEQKKQEETKNALEKSAQEYRDSIDTNTKILQDIEKQIADLPDDGSKETADKLESLKTSQQAVAVDLEGLKNGLKDVEGTLAGGQPQEESPQKAADIQPSVPQATLEQPPTETPQQTGAAEQNTPTPMSYSAQDGVISETSFDTTPQLLGEASTELVAGSGKWAPPAPPGGGPGSESERVELKDKDGNIVKLPPGWKANGDCLEGDCQLIPPETPQNYSDQAKENDALSQAQKDEWINKDLGESFQSQFQSTELGQDQVIDPVRIATVQTMPELNTDIAPNKGDLPISDSTSFFEEQTKKAQDQISMAGATVERFYTDIKDYVSQSPSGGGSGGSGGSSSDSGTSSSNPESVKKQESEITSPTDTTNSTAQLDQAAKLQDKQIKADANEATVNDIAKEIDTNNSRLQEIEKNIKDLQDLSDKETDQKKIDENTNEIVNLGTEKDDLTARNEEIGSIKSQLEEENKSLQNEIGLDSKIKDLNTQVEGIKEEIAHLDPQKDSEKISGLQDQLNQLDTESIQSQRDINISEATRTHNGLLEAIDEREKQIADNNEYLKNLPQDTPNKDEIKTQIEEDNKQLQSDIDSYGGQITKNTYDSNQATINSYKDELGNLDNYFRDSGRIAEINKEIETIQKENDDLKGQLPASSVPDNIEESLGGKMPNGQIYDIASAYKPETPNEGGTPNPPELAAEKIQSDNARFLTAGGDPTVVSDVGGPTPNQTVATQAAKDASSLTEQPQGFLASIEKTAGEIKDYVTGAVETATGKIDDALSGVKDVANNAIEKVTGLFKVEQPAPEKTEQTGETTTTNTQESVSNAESPEQTTGASSKNDENLPASADPNYANQEQQAGDKTASLIQENIASDAGLSTRAANPGSYTDQTQPAQPNQPPSNEINNATGTDNPPPQNNQPPGESQYQTSPSNSQNNPDRNPTGTPNFAEGAQGSMKNEFSGDTKLNQNPPDKSNFTGGSMDNKFSGPTTLNPDQNGWGPTPSENQQPDKNSSDYMPNNTTPDNNPGENNTPNMEGFPPPVSPSSDTTGDHGGFDTRTDVTNESNIPQPQITPNLDTTGDHGGFDTNPNAISNSETPPAQEPPSWIDRQIGNLQQSINNQLEGLGLNPIFSQDEINKNLGVNTNTTPSTSQDANIGNSDSNSGTSTDYSSGDGDRGSNEGDRSAPDVPSVDPSTFGDTGGSASGSQDSGGNSGKENNSGSPGFVPFEGMSPSAGDINQWDYPPPSENNSQDCPNGQDENGDCLPDSTNNTDSSSNNPDNGDTVN